MNIMNKQFIYLYKNVYNYIPFKNDITYGKLHHLGIVHFLGCVFLSFVENQLSVEKLLVENRPRSC